MRAKLSYAFSFIDLDIMGQAEVDVNLSTDMAYTILGNSMERMVVFLFRDIKSCGLQSNRCVGFNEENRREI